MSRILFTFTPSHLFFELLSSLITSINERSVNNQSSTSDEQERDSKLCKLLIETLVYFDTFKDSYLLHWPDKSNGFANFIIDDEARDDQEAFPAL